MEKSIEYLRQTWTITVKDILDALRHKIVLMNFLTALFMIVLYYCIPFLEAFDTLPRLAVYDQGDSRLVEDLKDREGYDLYEMSSRQAMEEYLADKTIVVLGLIIPVEFDASLEASEGIELEGYVVQWVSASEANEAQRFFERRISERAGVPVRIRIEGNTIYNQKESIGASFMASAALVLAVTMMGVSVLPHLMIEEKTTRTLDAILVSPAGLGQVAIAKALTGLFCCSLVAAIALILNKSLVTHWWLAILASLVGSLFAVSLGLLLGGAFENKQQLSLWGFLIFIPLFIPMFLSVMTDLVPETWLRFMDWVPTVAFSRLVRVSFSLQAPPQLFLPELALVLAYTGLFLALAAWVLRRSVGS